MIYAIGDIHGSIDQLATLHKMILKHATDEKNTVVCLGDYIDRGPDSKAVIEFLTFKPFKDFHHVYLKGNHEDMAKLALDACELAIGNMLRPEGWDVFNMWNMNGGKKCMKDYDTKQWAVINIDGLNKLLPLRKFMNMLAPYHIVGNFLFIHAGIHPRVPFLDQSPDTTLWIRETFLKYDGKFDIGFNGKEMTVVHGHTPVAFDPEYLMNTDRVVEGEPIIKANRINVDTGCPYSKKLSCAIIDNDGTQLLGTLST